MPADPPKRFISPAASPSRQPARVLARLTDRLPAGESETDAVPRLEQRIAELLGKPAAVMFPSGTMAQQVAMRIHADRRGVRTVLFHPQCHLEVHEHKGYAVVHGLTATLVGHPFSLITMDDLAEVHEPFAALLLELPQREIGGRLPSWDGLVAQTAWARERGAAVQLHFSRPPTPHRVPALTAPDCGSRNRSTAGRTRRSPGCSTPCTCRSTKD